MTLVRIFLWPIIASLIALVFVYLALGPAACATTGLLAVLEVSLSFDNAIVNARVLESMSAKWQQRFLTWGIAIAVVGTRLVLPIVIVSIVLGMSPFVVTHIALFEPDTYAQLLTHVHTAISAFGTAFLAMVALTFFFDEEKQIHWIEHFERRIARWGNIAKIEVLIVFVILMVAALFARDASMTIMFAGTIGVITHIAMDALVHGMSTSAARAARHGLIGFIYLNVLDSAFSLDGVIGAFALTTDIVVIAVGLGIGAYVVRTLTMHMVHARTLTTLRYLEHGAHWAIFGLSLCMAVSLVVPVPEIITAGVGGVFIIASYFSSRSIAR